MNFAELIVRLAPVTDEKLPKSCVINLPDGTTRAAW
jgi:hypothetical protein